MSDVPAQDQVTERLVNALLGWYKETVGRGPTSVKGFVHDDYVLVVMRNVQATVERTLVGHERADLVSQVQGKVREHYADEVCALVAREVGRPVATMLSDHHPQADVTALVFLLEPQE